MDYLIKLLSESGFAECVMNTKIPVVCDFVRLCQNRIICNFNCACAVCMCIWDVINLGFIFIDYSACLRIVVFLV